MKVAFAFLVALIATGSALAQSNSPAVTVGDALDIEHQVMMKKMADEAKKSSPYAQPASVPIVAKSLKEKPPAPVALAIYGVDNSYRGRLQIRGVTVPVRVGSIVGDFTVSSISPQGITLSRNMQIKAGSRAKKGASPANQQVFAPFVPE